MQKYNLYIMKSLKRTGKLSMKSSLTTFLKIIRKTPIINAFTT